MGRSPRRRWSGSAALAVLAVAMPLLGGCGSGDDDERADRSPPRSGSGSVTADGVLTACVETARPPFSTQAPDGTFTGLGPDLLALVAEQLDVELALEPLELLPPEGSPCEVVTGGFGYDVDRPADTTRGVGDGYPVSTPWLLTDALVGVTTLDAATVTELAAQGATIAVSDSSFARDITDALRRVEGLTVQLGVAGNADLADKATVEAALRSGEVDAAVDGWIFGVDMAASAGFGIVDLDDAPFTVGGQAWCLALREDVATEVDAALTAVIDDGGVAQLLDDRYGSVPGWVPFDGNTAAAASG